MKYYYKGISLREYCKKNNINYCSKLNKIYKLQKTNTTLSNDEIVRLVMENNIRSNIKYIYEGLPLVEYCKKNNINYYSKLEQIYKLQKTNPTLSNDEIVRLAMGKNVHGNIKYIYKGLPLVEYCKKNNINYYSKLEQINKLQKENPMLSNDEIIRLVLENNIHGNSKYTYEGLSLKQYCRENSLNYHTILIRISKLKKENQHIAINELIKIALDKHTKYMYEGLSLWEYCKNNDINYQTILYRINKFKDYYPSLENDELVQLSLKLKK